VRCVAALLILLVSCQNAKRVQPAREDRAGWRQLLRWSNDCEEAYQATAPGRNGLAFFPLGSGRSLVQVTCAMGAYQPSQVYYVVDDTGRTPGAVRFVTFEATGEAGDTLQRQQVEELTGLAEFNASTRVLSVWNKYRGPGDCGSYALYQFADGSARLREFRAKTECDGQGAEHPEQWPLRPQASP
jgi:hypothetical protein